MFFQNGFCYVKILLIKCIIISLKQNAFCQSNLLTILTLLTARKFLEIKPNKNQKPPNVSHLILNNKHLSQ